MNNSYDQATLSCLRAGRTADSCQPLVTPIFQTTTYCQGELGGEVPHAYSRVSNPTVSCLEEALGALEDAPPAIAFGTGLGAEAALFLATLANGGHVVCSAAVYGGTTRLLQQLLSGFGAEVDFVDTTSVDEVKATLRPSTRLVFIETPANPTLELSDIRAISDLAHDNGSLCAVDNTFLTGAFQKPLDLGADVSVVSTTKFVEGHSAAPGGAIISRNESLLERIRFVRKCTGGIQSPFGAWLTLQGLRTLPTRLATQSRHAGEIAEKLGQNELIKTVHYPGHAEGDQARIRELQHLDCDGAVIAFELRGGLEAGREVTRKVNLCSLVEHVGSIETLLTHPATMTHADTPREQREAAGLTDGLLRLSVGLEGADAILGDLVPAIEAADKSAAVAA